MILPTIFMFDITSASLLFCVYAGLLVTFSITSRYISSLNYLFSCGVCLLTILIIFLYNFEFIFIYNNTYSWITTNLTTSIATIPLSLNFSINPLSYSFATLVILIGGSTNFYLLTYFKGEANENIFIFWLNAFIASMLILVLANNLFTLFLGWELIGLTSFFLINFWSNRRATLKSSYKAFIFNLFSDVCLLGSFAGLFYLTGSDDCQTLFYICLYSDIFQHQLFQLVVLLLILCCSIKSVQLLGHLWLPDSMEAPVPASSLIHSATLVSAGVYLLCKFSYLIELSIWHDYAIFLGSITALYGGLVAAAQTDVKKLLAYSTMSHCGFLWVLACLGQFYITIIYLFLHGIFKAATFYCVGTFIRVFGTQDTRWMGWGLKAFSANALVLILCSANLCGLPFTIGYLYKYFFFKILYLDISFFYSIACLFLAAQTSLIYFYRLNFYLLFDFYKNIKLISRVYLAKTSLNNPTNWSLIRINHLFAIGVLLISSLLFSSLFNFLTIYFPLAITSLHENNTLASILNTEIVYSVYYIFFYSFYLGLAASLIILTNKASVLNLNIQTTIIYSIISLIFLKFYMWAYIMSEASSLTNFNFGFSTHKSDILIHLSQWQYWWWFWFSLFWSLYFFIIIRLVHKRTMQFNPIINTSTRGHGKWGDFVVALIPLSWCINILVNSNFILRMIEWQNESSLFTLRVQGKQWYWVYKFDGTAAYNILTAPKNIGHNNWFITTPSESYCADSYYQALQLGSQLEYKELYLSYLEKEKIFVKTYENQTLITNPVNFLSWKTNTTNYHLSFTQIAPKLGYYEFPLVDLTYDVTMNMLESVNAHRSLSIIKGTLNKHNLELLTTQETLDKPLLFVSKFNQDIDLTVKTEDGAPLWGYRQKKYKRLKKYSFIGQVSYDPITFQKKTIVKTSPFTLKSTLIKPLENTTSEDFSYQRMVVAARKRSELVPVNLARRLLRTKRTLVLPAHVNLTVVTNSYDVVHSWFIPGLGIKLDCVPGRSTHHSFYIDNVGFYYGQCAEICGRYHHHMPIRICALPFEQFLVWWQHKGIKRLHRIQVLKNNQQIVNTQDIKFRYKW